MTPRDEPVKRDGTTSREQPRTRAARRAVVEAATELFTRQGYVATTIAAISDRSTVSAPTVYRLFAGKIGILQAVLDTSIGGDDQQLAVQDRPALAALFAGADPAAMVAGVVAVTAGINERSNAVYRVLAAAAAADTSAAGLLAAVTEQRRNGQRQLTRALVRLKALQRGLSEPRAADIVYALMAPEIYRMLVTDRGWPPRRYQDWLTSTLHEQLLASPGPRKGPDSLPEAQTRESGGSR